MKNNTPTILIGCSRNIQSKNYLNRKVEKYLSRFDSWNIISVSDSNPVIDQLYPDKIIENIRYKSKPSKIDNILIKCDFAIFFWDGTDINNFIFRSLLKNIPTKIITIETTKVANKDRGDDYDVYIGRGSPWGNPFAIGDNGMSREDVINKFEVYFKEQILSDQNKVKELLSLKGKTLGCHCKPSACHGDIIAKYLNSDENT